MIEEMRQSIVIQRLNLVYTPAENGLLKAFKVWS